MLEFSVRHSLLYLQNEFITLAFDLSRNGSLKGIWDAGNFNLLHDDPENQTLFRLAVRRHPRDRVIWLDSRDAKNFTYLVDNGTGSTKLNFIVSGFPGHELAVTVSVVMDEDAAITRWRAAIGNSDGVSVFNIACPVVGGLFDVGNPIPGESVATGMQGEGYLFENPFPVVDHLTLKMGSSPITPHVGLGRLHGMYPGSQQMQFMLYNSDYAGLYLAAYDSGMHFKSFDLDRMPDWDAHIGYEYSEKKNNSEQDVALYNPVMSISHYPGEGADDEITFDYDTILGVFHGSWYDGADIYKQWSRRQWWCEKKLVDRPLPKWFRQGFGAFLFSNFSAGNPNQMIHSLDDIGDFSNRLADELGFPIFTAIFGWEGKGPWTSPKGLFPPREGIGRLFECSRRLKHAGSPLAISLPSDEWYLKLPFSPAENSFDCWEAFLREARTLAVERWDGELFIRRLDKGWEQVQLCPYSGELRTRVLDLFKELMAQGVDVIWEGGFPDGGDYSCCYAGNHGHAPGYGSWWAERHLQTLQKLEQELRDINPDFMHMGEGICEPFMPFLNLYDSRSASYEIFSHLEDNMPSGMRAIPLYNYVYGPYAGAVHAVYCECTRPETLYWTRCMGKSLVFGCVPMGSWYMLKPDRINDEFMDFYKRITAFAVRYCWPYVMFGEMLKPPVVDIPEMAFPYLKMSGSDISGFDGHQRFQVTDHAVEFSVWRAQNGRIGYILVNVSNLQVALDLVLSSYSDLQGRRHHIDEIENEQLERLDTGVCLPLTRRVGMAPFSMKLLEITVDPCANDETIPE